VLSRNTSVTKLIIGIEVNRFAFLAFQDFLACTQTLQTLQMDAIGIGIFNEVQIAAITSGFANNTTLRNVAFQGWGEANLSTVLTALQCHPTLQKIQLRQTNNDSFFPNFSAGVPTSSGLEVLLRSQSSKVKELVFDKVHFSTVDFHRLMQELGRNTVVTNFAFRDGWWTREKLQQLKTVLRQNTALQSLDPTGTALWSAGLAEIATVLYRNTSINVWSRFMDYLALL
jgi:hypothetical protein